MRQILLVVGAVACGAPDKQIEIGNVPPRTSEGTLAGALCTADECKCRGPEGDGGAGVPEGNAKRFEIRLGSPYELWAKLPQNRFYKSQEKPVSCFYVDLTPGQHQLELRASNANGIAATLEVHELGTQTKSWYDTFEFQCGNPGACSFEELDASKQKYAQYTKQNNAFDACGSTKVKNVIWDTGKSPDQQFPSEFVLRATLDVYKFVPDLPTGDASCGRRRQTSKDDQVDKAVPAPDAGSATPPSP